MPKNNKTKTVKKARSKYYQEFRFAPILSAVFTENLQILPSFTCGQVTVSISRCVFDADKYLHT